MNTKTIVKTAMIICLITTIAFLSNGHANADTAAASGQAERLYTEQTSLPAVTCALSAASGQAEELYTEQTSSPTVTCALSAASGSSVTGSAVTPSPSPEPTPEPSLRKQHKNSPATTIIDISGHRKKELKTMFYIRKIDDTTFETMQGRSYPKNCPIKRNDLRRVRILYYGYDHETHIGELIVNRARSVDMRDIFMKLYFRKYEIEKVQPIDAYDGNDTRSMRANNTSCYNYRVVEGTTSISKHAYGVAIDINPKVNPYVYLENGKIKVSPKNGRKYADRSKTYDHPIITHDDICYKLFHKRGYFWGGDWITIKDYQHFQKPL